VSSEDIEARYRALFDQCHVPVLAYALRRAPTPGAAEDAVADTFLVAWRRIGEVPAGDGALPWLIGVTRRVLANSRRGDVRRNRLIARLRQHDWGLDTSDAPDEAIVAGEQTARVRTALARLRPADAEILEMAFWDGMPQNHIAVILECSENAAGIRLHRARRALRAELEKDPAEAGHNSGIEPAGERSSDD
jgi:RNA polymerase sigma factor (sigma-70 family)